MDATQARQVLLDNVKVTLADVVAAKGYLETQVGVIDVVVVAKRRADAVVGPLDDSVPLWPSDPYGVAAQHGASYRGATCNVKASWELIHAGVMVHGGGVRSIDFDRP